ncbi:MAG: DNA (cytosine-5-)-methyltransferase [Microcystis aeruginosa W13-18]|jgi:DNA (cytosine-5)-methyltransferase 1|nr:DNA (cytosine-5-)-methyltransferase [Microcystis aeruginosa W13-18]NCR36456.1 DNA (cytosine-5-)-methyltransferase [Microcystis aeruginosa S11-05]NCR44924.1 DNA (cytosine-5-)-methyltransferase [Microcystis aeruginosa SX13-01]NCR49989.1 DNA (cytosine-5-)-methyltransferase [Microcystis aeruginosa S11-01]NCR90923.1 DNA (cytosine-5-)-methyltransferase [Microcystis aeruginosa G13-10]NCS17250.1 DNA (cytosine-5-)-methyltransferase [Microcystis aeruginosa G13-12]NCS21077.1 DNA (cytosine-5-)-methylt
MIPNHYSARLSELDLAMAIHIPPGGNWKNIPTSIPSQRLAQIRESYAKGGGSRSTYYGRLRPDAPAYTINTYFGRPGNGCHLHYDYAGGQHRVISQREAARLQSFPDDFVFLGSRTAINTQIGNAVPPLLGYQIALHLGSSGIFVDLFSGAGGLALGFKWAGWLPVIANDIERIAIETYAKNVDSSVIVGDIQDPEISSKISSMANVARQLNPDAKLFVLGGPPCQGFSTAGNSRSMQDGRNSLFRNYTQIITLINPDGFVFENVMGLLNMEQGRVFEQIKMVLESVTDQLSVWKLDTANYGIPQRRKRVILVGLKQQLQILPPPVVTGDSTENGLIDLPSAVTTYEALSDLPPLESSQDGESLDYIFPPATDYQELMRGYISPEQYLNALRKKAEASKSRNIQLSMF